MNTSKHTPGPWEQAPCFMIQSKKGNYICQIDASEGREHHANAKLIAAAPELLAALRKLVPLVEMGFSAEEDVFGVSHNDATDALSEAETLLSQFPA